MTDLPELKAGESREYDVKGQKILLEPLSIGQLKKVFSILDKPKEGDFTQTIADYLLLVLDVSRHPFLTREWIENNVTLPVYNQIVADATAINGLSGFLNSSRKRETRELAEATPPTPADSVTSITPSASPTNGQ